MLIEYISSEGIKMSYDTGDSVVTCEVISQIAMQYAESHTDRLPSHVFMNLHVFGEFSRSMFKGYTLHPDPIDGQLCMTLMVATGILIVKPIPAMYNEFTVVVGTENDLQNILVDKVFEEIVLKDCDREEEVQGLQTT